MEDDTERKTHGHLTGGDSLAYMMLYDFDMQADRAGNFVVIRRGDYPLYDLRFRVRDKDRELAVRNESWGEHNSTADYRIVNWPLAEGVYYRVFFFARNGSWLQDLQLRRSEKAACWLAATRVTGHPHATDFEYTDEEFNAAFGTPQWRD